jgi:uncharacterized membrane protein
MSEAPTTSERPPRQSRWLFPALIASLALNLLFIGGIGAAAWQKKHHRGHGFGADFGLMGFVRELPDDRAAVVREQITKARESTRPLKKAVREAWRDANATLTVEPFDKEKFKAAMARASDAESQFKAAIAGGLADMAEKLTAEERAKLQAWREKRSPRLFGKGPKGSADSPPGDGGAEAGPEK